MLWHDYETYDLKPVFLPYLFEDRQKNVTRFRSSQKGLAAIATRGDENADLRVRSIAAEDYASAEAQRKIIEQPWGTAQILASAPFEHHEGCGTHIVGVAAKIRNKFTKGSATRPLRLCHQAGLVKLGNVAIDGTKMLANASTQRSLSHKALSEHEQYWKATVKRMLIEAENTDQQEDQRYGKGRASDPLPEELAHAQSRLARIQQAKAETKRGNQKGTA